MTKSAYTAPGLTLDEIEKAVGRGLGWQSTDDDWSTAGGERDRIDQAITAAGQACLTWEGRLWPWAIKWGRFQTLTDTDITHVERSSNVATIYLDSDPEVLANCRIQVTGVTASGFDTDDALVSAVNTTADTITYTNVGDDAAKTADTTGSVYAHGYPLRTVYESDMEDIYAPIAVWKDDDYALNFARPLNYKKWLTLYSTANSNPQEYTTWGSLNIGISPIPDTSIDIYVQYIRRHSKITNAGSTDAALIVPGEFHWPIYVDGAVWLIKHECSDPMALHQSPQFVEAMRAMAAASPDNYADTSAVGYPPGKKIYVLEPEDM